MHTVKRFVASLGLVALAAGAVPALTGAAAAGAATPRPTLTLIGPSHALVGQMVAFDLVARGAPDLGAYQATLRFDGAALAVARVRAPRTLPGSGAFTALSAVETPNRKVLAGWSCAGPGCQRDAGGAVTTTDASTVLSTIDVVALRPGRIDLRIDGARLVRRSGALLARASTRTQFTSGNGTTEYAAPLGNRVAASTADAGNAPRVTPDVNGDGRVTPLDANALTADFVTAAEHDRDCVAPAPGDDTDGDGCMTIADLQTVAAAISAAPANPSPAAVRSAPIKTFTVTSTGDGPTPPRTASASTSRPACAPSGPRSRRRTASPARWRSRSRSPAPPASTRSHRRPSSRR